jgi:kynurenine formamidase
MPEPTRILMSQGDFEGLRNSLQVSSVRHADASDIAAAARLVRCGLVVSAGEGPATAGKATEGPGGPYRLVQWRVEADAWQAVNDRIELDLHGSGSMTHMDAFSHFAWLPDGDGQNGDERAGAGSATTVADVTRADADQDLARGAIVGRGVLVDVPGLVGSAVPPGHVVTLADIGGALERQNVQVGPGDALWLRFGRTRQRFSDDDLVHQQEVGLSIACATWMARMEPSVVITDFGMDGTPSEVHGIPVPWHVLLLTSLRIPLVDMADLTAVAQMCEAQSTWEFMSVIAPLPLPGATGSPVNPLAIF